MTPKRLELEEAQAQAEALLAAEAGEPGTVDARAEVRAPAATAGYTQRAPRPRPGFDRQRGGRPGWWAEIPTTAKTTRGSEDQRPIERGPGNSGADCQGTHREERRAHHQPHRAAGKVSGVYADGESHRGFHARSLLMRSGSG